MTRNSIGEGTGGQRWRALALAPPLLAAALFLPWIGERIIYIGDEARYALLARTMVETGGWLVPRLGSEVHMEKTPLFIWAIAALSLLGRRVTELTAVLPAALSGIGGVGLTVVLGRGMFGPRAGVLAGLVLATSWGFFWHARLALADMMVTFFVVGAVAAFWASVGDGRARRGPMAICWVCLGLGLSSKGPVGLMPLVPMAAFLIAEHGWSGLGRLRPLMGVAIVALVSAPWALAFALQRETSYVQSVLIDDFLLPRLHGARRWRDVFFAAGPIGVGFLLWTPLLAPALRHGWWRPGDDATRRAFRLLVFWTLAYVVVITLVPHKRDRYLLPTYPAMALMVGWLWDRWATRPTASPLRLHAWVWAVLAVLLGVAVLLPLRPRLEQAMLVPPTLSQKLVVTGLMIVAAAGVIVAASAARPLAMFGAICVPGAVLLAVVTPWFVAAHNRAYDVRSLAHRMAARVEPEAEIITYRYQPLALQFYAARPVKRVRTVGEVMGAAAGPRPVYVVAEDRAWPDLTAATPATWRLVERTDLDGRPVSVRTLAGRP